MHSVSLKSYISVLLVYLSSGSLYYTSFDNNLFIFALLISGFLLFITSNPAKISGDLAIYFVITVFVFLLNGILHPSGFWVNVGVILKIIACIFIILSIKYEFPEAFKIVSYHLAIASIILYVDLNTLQIMTDNISNFLPDLKLNDKTIYYNYGFLAEMHSSAFGSVETEKGRNIGIFWEPGAYQFVLNLALSIHLNKSTKIDKYSIVFIIAILTTFSTTGYIILSYTLILFSIRKGAGIQTIILLLAVLSGATAFMLLSKHGIEKISLLWSYNYSLSGGLDFEGSQSRIFDTITDIYLFIESPIYGHGVVINEIIEYVYKGERLGSSNSLSHFLAAYGITGLMYLYPMIKKDRPGQFGPLGMLFWLQMSVINFIVSPIVICFFILSFIKPTMASKESFELK